MLLRNYDNLLVKGQIALTDATTTIDGYDNGLAVKLEDGNTRNYVSGRLPMTVFKNTNNNVNGYSSNLICGYDENEVTYDDYKIASIPALNFVAHSWSEIIYDEENNTYTREYYKTYTNPTADAIIINCIGVKDAPSSSNSSILVYKEKLPKEVTIAGYGSIQLKFKTVVSGNPNKPTDYVASASVE